MEFPQLLLALRSAAERHFPKGLTPIAEHIQIMALALSSDGRPCSIKDFSAVLPYSDERISQLVHKMAEDGLLTLQRSVDDRRVKHVVPSPALRRLYETLESDVQEALGHYVSAKLLRPVAGSKTQENP
jgi:DNA-binding MarR family transcriptional regulator